MCVKLVTYQNYTKMHGPKNIKYNAHSFQTRGRSAMVQAVGSRPRTPEARVRPQVNAFKSVEEWHWDRVLYKYFRLCPAVSFHQNAIRSYQMNGRNLGTFQAQCSCGNRGALE
jgi:hypothetical protein